MPTALITGITGQDGSYLAEFLLEKGYEVHGIIRRSSSFNTERIEHLYLDQWVRDQHEARRLHLHYGDMTDSSSLTRIIALVKPDEIYNLAAQSHVKVSFDVPEYTAETDALGTLRLLESVRILGREKSTRIYQASTSELFGQVQEMPQTEKTPFYPRSPYAVAKLYSFWIMKNYRESYGMFTANGILFNHESERRGENFVTRKITLAAARIAAGRQDKLYLGNLDARRDWAMRPTMWNVCGSFSSRTNPTILSLPQASSTASASSPSSLSHVSASSSAGKDTDSMKKALTVPPGVSSSRSTSVSSVPPRLKNCLVIPKKRGVS